MADNIFTKFGGKVKYTPEKVKSDIGFDGTYNKGETDNIFALAQERDLVAANLLENEILLDVLDSVIDDQMKDFSLPHAAAQTFCGGEVITWECYKKAKELLRIAPWIANGYDPIQLNFTDRLTKRKGNIVFDCREFDPDKFHNVDFESQLAEATGDNTESPKDIEERAQENQKKWSLLMLFWDLLWGKPSVKKLEDVQNENDRSLDEINKDINKLNEDNQKLKELLQTLSNQKDIDETNKLISDNDIQISILTKRLTRSDFLPNNLMVGRPMTASALQWLDKDEKPLISNFNKNYEKYVINPSELLRATSTMKVNPFNSESSRLVKNKEYPWNSNSVAVWIAFSSLFKSHDEYKDKSIPALDSGFILPILIGFLGLIPKFCFFFFKWRFDLLAKIAKWPYIFKKSIGEFIRILVNLVVAIPALLNTTFIEICIWLAIKPHDYRINIDDEYDIKQSDKINKIDILDTPAGFVSLDCIKYANDIVNAVHASATEGV